MKILKPASGIDPDRILESLPPEIILNILSRIPIKTVFTCKCVCRSFLELFESPEFTRSHLSYSVPGLLIHQVTDTNAFKIFEFQDSSSPEIERHELHYRSLLELKMVKMFEQSCGWGTRIEGSADGLLFMRNGTPGLSNHYVCNPITREYIRIPEPEGTQEYRAVASYGFGVTTSSSNEYKVVRIFHDYVSIPDPVWQVYTLGTASWRSITAPPEMLLEYNCHSFGTPLNGNLHWLARDLKGSWWISCFDLETEAFSKFRAPAVQSDGALMEIGVLRDQLSLCDNSSETEIGVYLMGDYGNVKSWNKEHVISKVPWFEDKSYEYEVIRAVNVFGDGDMLMAYVDWTFVCSATRTNLKPRG